MSSTIRFILFVTGLLFAIATSSQEVRFLAIRGDGTASVILDKESGTAYINDGGRAGTRGIAGATIDGLPVLEHLLKEQVRTLVISCSHPHEDHMGGLESQIQGQKILEFEKLALIDAIKRGAISDRGKPISRLQDVFIAAHGEDIAAQKLIARLDPAIDANRFAELNLRPGAVSVQNYKYNPVTIGGDVHDAAMIIETRVRVGEIEKLIVDFDDASSALIKQWATDRPDERVDVIVAAHHGSRRNDMSPALKMLEKGKGDIIFTVNEGNQFLHPSPRSLDAAIRAVGVDRVHITGSRSGNNVSISAQGVSSPTLSAASGLAQLIEQRADRATGVISASGVSETAKKRAMADRTALIAIARAYDIKVRDDLVSPEISGPSESKFPELPRAKDVFAGSGGRTSTAPVGRTSTGASIGTGGRTPNRPGSSKSVGGSCVCVGYRGAVEVSRTEIPYGAACGGQICGQSGQLKSIEELYRSILSN